MSNLKPDFGHNAYLALAYEALRRAKKPLTPSEMLDFADRYGFMPGHLHGSTKHKTLSARLAEHIRAESQGSVFYRTAPATFYAHPLAKLPETPIEFKTVFSGHLRAKSIRKENVLVANRTALGHFLPKEFTDLHEFNFLKFFETECAFMDRARAEVDDEVKQFVTFTIIYHGNKILIYRRGNFTTTSDTLKGQLSLGFGGHVNDADFSLFDQGTDAFRANACRELREELFLDEIYRDPDETYSRTDIAGYLNTDDSPDAEHHLAVLVLFRHASDQVPKKGELSINQLEWLDLRSPLNDLSDFDLWSGKILQKLYEGSIKLGGAGFG